MSVIGSDKRADETWPQWAARKHDEAHGPACTCPGNPGRRGGGLPLPPALRTLDTVPEGQRVELHQGETECAACGDPVEDRTSELCDNCTVELAEEEA